MRSFVAAVLLCARRGHRLGPGRAAGAAAHRPGDRPDRHADAGAGRSAARTSWRRSRRQHGAQIVILIVPTTAPEDIASFAQRVGEQLEDRPQGRRRRPARWSSRRTTATCSIQVAKALQGAMPDIAAGRIIQRADRAGVSRRRLRRRPEHRGRPARRADRQRRPAGAGGRAPAAPRRDSPSAASTSSRLAIFLFIGVPIVGGILSRIDGQKARRARDRRGGRRRSAGS